MKDQLNAFKDETRAEEGKLERKLITLTDKVEEMSNKLD